MKKVIATSFFLMISSLVFATSKIELRLNQKIIIQNKDISEAAAIQNNSEWSVSIKLKPSATKKLASVTKGNVGKKMDIILNDQVLSSPIIQDEINSGTFIMDAHFTEQEAKNIAIDAMKRIRNH